MADFKPLLAAPVDFKFLDYGNLWLSPKLDGIRAIVIDGVVMSRSLKPIPNTYVQKLFGVPELEGFDGELICGEPNASDVYRDTNSAVMSRDGDPPVCFFVFDCIVNPDADYQLRYEDLLIDDLPDGVQIVDQHRVSDHDHLLALEERYLEAGYEGVMLRKFCGPQSRYKFGRSTAKEGTLLKLKRFTDAEATVVGFEELLKNGNEATVNALGRTERSSHKENLIPMDTLGALLCQTPEGIRFAIGTGFDQATRAHIWANRQRYLGCLTKYKSFDIGVKTAPRFPVFQGWRDPIDFSKE